MGTFVRCDKLTEITLGTGLTKFNEGGALASTAIKKINFRGSEEEWKKIEITNEGDIAIIAAAQVVYNFKG